MQFDRITGELNIENYISSRLCMIGWTPYYNLEGKYVGFKCSGCGNDYSLLDLTYVPSYNDLDW